MRQNISQSTVAECGSLVTKHNDSNGFNGEKKTRHIHTHKRIPINRPRTSVAISIPISVATYPSLVATSKRTSAVWLSIWIIFAWISRLSLSPNRCERKKNSRSWSKYKTHYVQSYRDVQHKYHSPIATHAERRKQWHRKRDFSCRILISLFIQIVTEIQSWQHYLAVA